MADRVALVTGGTTGIGKAAAVALAERGVDVVVTGRRVREGELAADEVQRVSTGDARVHFIRSDVSVESDVKDLFEAVRAQFGRLDFAVNNAGTVLDTKPLVETDSEQFRRLLDINVLGLYYCMKAEIALMLAQGGGAIVNVSSTAGLGGFAWAGPYVASKHAVVGLTKSAALDYATSGIRINAVAPGAIQTELLNAQLRDTGIGADTIAGMHPMMRFGTPKEVGNAIAWLLSEEASFVTGSVLSVDGGLRAK